MQELKQLLDATQHRVADAQAARRRALK